ncbi:NADH-quinone oxidoreductase subunit L [Kordiimonas sp. SCSIO 12603]|uniref:NADH-quinone oxidoreductase subunit L n=1 Tax=Kordiimonas sp. SCSIO 12603 TaxID=2829596 RepID=UPI002102C55E|nr:NADH-quinone oxidoreductase subunit L [Kordiimonas sp. SCSIO 12603]UTW57499.1 NADH-quinone oxidoreductase subunit L [Kordiimonas sp. SCSIO 12603]
MEFAIKTLVFLPLIGFLIAGIFGSKIGDKASQIVTTGLLFISAALSWMVFLDVALDGNKYPVTLFNWVTSGTLSFDWSVSVDALTAVMLVVVNSVSALVHLYSTSYMEEDPHKPRFFAYLSLFTFMMLMLVTSDNLVQMFFGWEGVGVASYLLIGFWFKKPTANAAAIKAFVVNRVGDFGFALGIYATFLLFGSVEFDVIFANVGQYKDATMSFLGHDYHALTVVCLLLFVGAMGKSAQLGLHTWLPDAMEGPTPVSALIHAATMVTAGVFLVARFSPVFVEAPDAMAVVTVVGALTAFFAATVGLVQNDIKRVIAYSTCSQLGYMFVALGVGAFGGGVFHLFTHAFFKALLFLGAGSVIHAMHHEQDMRNMGGLLKKIPFTATVMFIGNLAITGVPLLSGYYSKDLIIEAAFAAHSGVGEFAFFMTVVAALMTSFYSWRLWFMTFLGESRADAHTYDHAHEGPMFQMRFPLAVLAFGAVFAGMTFKEAFIGHDVAGFWNGAVDLSVKVMSHGESLPIMEAAHHVPGAVKLAPMIAMIVGLLLAAWFYARKTDLPQRTAKTFNLLYDFLLNKWYFDELYDFLFVKPSFALGRIFWKRGDEQTIDGFGPNGVSAAVAMVAAKVRKLQTGYVYHYAFAMIVGLAAIVTWFMASGISSGAGH